MVSQHIVPPSPKQIASRTKWLTQELRPIVHQALSFSMADHKEVVLRIIYQLIQGKIQIKQDTSLIEIYRVNQGTKICGQQKKLSIETLNMRTEIVLSSVEVDIEQIFIPSPNMHELLSIELSFKFRDAAMVSLCRMELRRKAQTLFGHQSYYENVAA